jgi:putative sigma-54 modulation protein
MAQKLEIFGSEFEVTDHIRDYVTKKVEKFDRHLGTIDEIRVDLSHIKAARSSSDRYVAQMTVRGKGFILRAEERADDIRTAMDKTIDKLSRQIVRFKEKRSWGRGEAKDVVQPDVDLLEMGVDETDEHEVSPVLVRRKKFDVIPMDEMEAIEQMKLLGHDNFFIFCNAKTGAVNVLYRRRDGTYGLIEPYIS